MPHWSPFNPLKSNKLSLTPSKGRYWFGRRRIGQNLHLPLTHCPYRGGRCVTSWIWHSPSPISPLGIWHPVSPALSLSVEVEAATFHGLCYQILKAECETVGLSISAYWTKKNAKPFSPICMSLNRIRPSTPFRRSRPGPLSKCHCRGMDDATFSQTMGKKPILQHLANERLWALRAW